MLETQYSLLLSLYQKEKPEYLHECLQSLSKQTVPAAECVIVYDGPIPKELESIVEKWKEPLLIKTVRLKQNVGLGLALNEGLKYCSNEIVARADTDDIYEPERMRVQLMHLMNHPDCIIVGSLVAEFASTPGDLDRIKSVPESTEEIREYAKKRNPFNHMSVCYRKSYILALGGYKHHLFMEDYNLWVRAISKNYNLYNLQKVLVQVRIGENAEMIKRRRGLRYIKSEFQLAQLILKNKINNRIGAYMIFTLRSLSRIIPSTYLSKIYRHLRRPSDTLN